MYEQCAVAITLGSLLIIVYCIGEGLVEHADRVAAPQHTLGTEILKLKLEIILQQYRQIGPIVV
jgi:hypothetical protein